MDILGTTRSGSQFNSPWRGTLQQSVLWTALERSWTMAAALLQSLWRVTGGRAIGARGRRAPKFGRRMLGDLVHIPPCLTGTDPCFIAEWAEGWFTLDGLPVALDGRSPFEVLDAPSRWQEALHGFGWLADVPLAPEDDLSTEARDKTRALVATWLTTGANKRPVAVHGAVTARRLVSFLAHADLVLENADSDFFDHYTHRVATDAGFLMEQWPSLADEARLLALIAVAQAGLSCAGGNDLHARAEAALLTELDRQIRSDGGHISRDPHVVSALLLDLVPLKQLYTVADKTVPAALVLAIRRMTDLIAALRLGDGSLTRLAASRRESGSHLPPLTLVDTPPPLLLAPASGFARVTAGETVLVVDVGAERHSDSALAFELSAGTEPIISSSGVLPGEEDQRRAQAGRHATLAVEAEQPPSVRGAPITLSPRQTATLETLDGIGVRLDATHAGTSAFGFAHRRVFDLATDGRRLSGHDTLRALAGLSASARVPLAFHFQLHPDVTVEAEPSGTAARLKLCDGAVWRFETLDGRVSIEDSVMVRNGRAVASWQLVVRGAWPDLRGLSWVFEKV